jgi:uncharacterized repeat protein (TIGR03803 family)
MRLQLSVRFAAFAVILALNLAAWPTRAASQTEIVLHSFDDMTGDAAIPGGGLASDSSGNLYGTGSEGGTTMHNLGAVFELNPATGGSWTEKVLRNFSGGNGYSPEAAPTLDAAGNLYGTTIWGGGLGVNYCGQDGCGAVFELSPKAGGGWTETLIHRFDPNGSDGLTPYAGLVFDAAGNLYGATIEGGIYNQGVVFELARKSSGGWEEKILHNFNGKDGGFPFAALIFDSAGNLYGTTSRGGLYGGGTVFELSPNADGGWTRKVLHSFNTNSSDGSGPLGGLVMDASGNLYGTTTHGGSSTFCVNNQSPTCGTVFELIPGANGSWSEKVLHNFGNGTDGVNPTAGLTFDASGNLYGTTYGGGAYDSGTVFKLVPGSGNWTETTVYSFGNGSDGSNPWAGLISGPGGVFYGTTLYGGTHATGTVFEIIP